MKDYEHQLQVNCVNWFRYQYPNVLIMAIPNGGNRNLITAMKLKAEGVVSGVPDLFIPVSNGKYHGMFIEMKYGKNKPSENQIKIMDILLKNGYECKVIYTIEKFIEEVNKYLR